MTAPTESPAVRVIREAVAADRAAIVKLIQTAQIKSHVISLEGEKIDKGVVGAQRILAQKVADLPPYEPTDEMLGALVSSARAAAGASSKGLVPPKGGSSTAPAQHAQPHAG